MIDWNGFVELENYKTGTLSQTFYDKMVDKLIKEGVLSLEETNNYFLSTGSITVSPRHSRMWRSVLYFNKRKDAEEYAKIKYSGALFHVSVHKNTL